jgi:hypothetical protein
VNTRPGASERLAEAIANRQRAQALGGLRKLAARGVQPQVSAEPIADAGEACDLCARGVPAEHRHMLNLDERLIVCVCETCWGIHSGDAAFRPVGNRTVWLEGFKLPDDIWATFQIPIGLAFFMYSSTTECIVALYPSPAGATESELHFSTWQALVEVNPVLEDLEPDVEALIVNRMGETPAYAIAPIDRCYMLVGLIKVNWRGISGGPGVAEAVGGFFDDLRRGAVVT